LRCVRAPAVRRCSAFPTPMPLPHSLIAWRCPSSCPSVVQGTQLWRGVLRWCVAPHYQVPPRLSRHASTRHADGERDVWMVLGCWQRGGRGARSDDGAHRLMYRGGSRGPTSRPARGRSAASIPTHDRRRRKQVPTRNSLRAFVRTPNCRGFVSEGGAASVCSVVGWRINRDGVDPLLHRGPPQMLRAISPSTHPFTDD
jgi:hypothetical protein